MRLANILLVAAVCLAQETNPLASDPKAAEERRWMFRILCAPCHGIHADGGRRPRSHARGRVVFRHGWPPLTQTAIDPAPQNLGDTPGLRDVTARCEGWLSVENFANGTDSCFSQMRLEAIQELPCAF